MKRHVFVGFKDAGKGKVRDQVAYIGCEPFSLEEARRVLNTHENHEVYKLLLIRLPENQGESIDLRSFCQALGSRAKKPSKSYVGFNLLDGYEDVHYLTGIYATQKAAMKEQPHILMFTKHSEGVGRRGFTAPDNREDVWGLE